MHAITIVDNSMGSIVVIIIIVDNTTGNIIIIIIIISLYSIFFICNDDYNKPVALI